MFIVDYEEGMCLISLMAVLRNFGYLVAYVMSGEVALENIQQRTIDLLSLTFHITDFNGFVMLDRILTKMRGTLFIHFQVIFETAF